MNQITTVIPELRFPGGTFEEAWIQVNENILGVITDELVYTAPLKFKASLRRLKGTPLHRLFKREF